jgi:hypothetical protein
MMNIIRSLLTRRPKKNAPSVRITIHRPSDGHHHWLFGQIVCVPTEGAPRKLNYCTVPGDTSVHAARRMIRNFAARLPDDWN